MCPRGYELGGAHKGGDAVLPTENFARLKFCYYPGMTNGQLHIDELRTGQHRGHECLSARVRTDARETLTWFRWKGRMSPLAADAMLLAHIEPAMKAGLDLHFDDAISPSLARQLPGLTSKLRALNPDLADISIHAMQTGDDPVPENGETGRGLLFDGSIHSYRAFHYNAEDIDNLVFMSQFHDDRRVESGNGHAIKARRHRSMDLEKPVLEVETNHHQNINDLLSHLPDHHYLEPLMLSRLLSNHLSCLVVPPRDECHEQHPAYGDYKIHLDDRGRGGSEHIEDNQELLFRNYTILESLRVCWENPDRHYNCGRCRKCTRRVPGRRLIQLLERDSRQMVRQT